MAANCTVFMERMVEVTQRTTLRAVGALAHRGMLFAMLLLVAVRAFAGGAVLAWDPVTSAALAGYKVYYGPAAGSYTSNIDVGNTTTYTVANLVEGQTYHFAATAYDANHTESAFSNDASATVPYSAPVAQFSASTTSGTAPLALNFTSTSTGSISAYAWTFGDGGTGTAQNPAHVYSAAGVYSVSLTVTGSGGSNTKTNTNYVTVSAPPPVAAFSGSPTSGTTPLTVNFTSTPTGSVSSYAWTFGDGGTSTVQNPSHVYSTAGVYTVSLTVTGSGISNTKTNTGYVTVSAPPAAPVAAFSASPISGTTPLTVNFTNASTGSISSYAWTFGDGGTSAVQNPSHVYASAGTYTVALTVTGPGGSNTISHVVTATSSGGGGGTNFALASNGAIALASSTYVVSGYDFSPASLINNERTGTNWGNGGGWIDATPSSFPDWVEIDFNGSKTIDHVVVYSVQDNWASPIEPTDTLTFTQYGVTAFDVQVWNGSGWVTVGSVTGNNLVKRTVSFSPTATTKIRIVINSALNSYSRFTEVEAWGN